ncbi:CxxH/CxxC protein [Domibacillus epiphyticus]|uniref:CxxH/CxxC protein n=1 Tax=Domibacillus epiphyticus TaxID=1714355 RepID=A0A1V2A6D0_9BACI|nr:CxxH/CxxC protein [Domibacillus epiphyticus]OMP66422.1 CxxH/CxxC protein [Domibacillus epiphyticus]
MYCCSEHVELALDIAVDENETAPVIEKTDEETACEFCERVAIYIVGN